MPHPSLKPHRFKKRPAIIEAMQFDGSGTSQVAIKSWAGDAVTSTFDDEDGWGVTVSNRHLNVDTLHGITKAKPGDWIVRGEAGDFWPVHRDIFPTMYEPFNDPTIIDED